MFKKDSSLLWVWALPVLMLMAATAVAQEEDIAFWPKSMMGDNYEVVMYQPQIESFNGNTLESRAAISVKSIASGEMVFGAMWFASRLETDQETRMARMGSVEVTASKFPDSDPEKVEKLSRFLEQEMPKWDLVISIDALLADLADDGGASTGDEGFKDDPPVIHFRSHPAVLVVVDGDPIFSELNGFELDYVVNSAYFIVRDRGTKRNFLRGSGMWFTADDLGGPWAVTTDLPGEVAKVSVKVEEDEAAQAAEAAEDAQALGLEEQADEAPPEIILTTVPAELIVCDGEMDFATVEGTQLLYLNNTESDVLMDIAGQQYYVLLAGRWYRSASLENGPWEFVPTESLPADFSAIPSDSDMATVLASVPGTQESREAVLDTQIPQTAEVDRKTATCEVTYDGDPEFESCMEGVAYALNTDKDVLKIGDEFYCVDNAVWFVSSGPEGPWAVATEVPAVIQELPPECPVYNVKYVYIYETTPEVVYVGYTSGYYGSYVYGGVVVYGTGWYYHPWYRHYYYPRPVTYGWGVHYSSYGGWGFSYGVSYGWVHIGVGWGRPYYGCWGRGGYRYGYRRGYWHGYNRGYHHGYRRGASAGYRAGYRAGSNSNRPSHHNNAYRNRSNGVAKTGDVRRDTGKQPRASDRKNNVYTDRDGNVYRDKDGTWEKRDKGEWSRDDKSGDRNSDRNRDETRDQDRSSDRSRDQSRDQSTDRSRDQSRDQSADRSRDQSRDRSQSADRDRGSSSNRQQLDRDRSSRDRGQQRQQQSPQRGGGSRGGGGRGGRR